MKGHEEPLWRRHPAVIVTVIVIVLSGAIAWGTTISRVGTTEDDVADLRGNVQRADKERSELQSARAVHESQLAHIITTLASTVVTGQTLGQAVARLEAIVSRHPSSQP
jgi:septal ring factor EnvC (AmiA/AmiB activator)